MRKLLPIALATFVVTGALASTAAASTFPTSFPVLPPKVPAEIQPEAGNVPFEVGHAIGVQVYQCNGAGTWAFVEPKAILLTNRLTVIHHFAGPTWQHQGGRS